MNATVLYLRLYRAMSSSVVDAFCCRNRALIILLRILCAPFVLELTRLGIKMERMIARDGQLHDACAWLVDIATHSIDIQGAESIPREGPLVCVVANHAGLGDAHAVLTGFAAPRHPAARP